MVMVAGARLPRSRDPPDHIPAEESWESAAWAGLGWLGAVLGCVTRPGLTRSKYRPSHDGRGRAVQLSISRFSASLLAAL